MTAYVDVDVRPILRAGGEPFAEIMSALERLVPGQGLRLLATFKPVPLFAVMEKKGFASAARPLDDGEWEVLFTPKPVEPETADAAIGPFDDEAWPQPSLTVDARDLAPPEPMVQILAAAERLQPGATLSAQLHREPVFLFPQLETRGYGWLGGFVADGTTYELTVRAPA
jgi:uncharacterized protein (DUF2249 family)